MFSQFTVFFNFEINVLYLGKLCLFYGFVLYGFALFTLSMEGEQKSERGRGRGRGRPRGRAGARARARGVSARSLNFSTLVLNLLFLF